MILISALVIYLICLYIVNKLLNWLFLLARVQHASICSIWSFKWNIALESHVIINYIMRTGWSCDDFPWFGTVIFITHGTVWLNPLLHIFRHQQQHRINFMLPVYCWSLLLGPCSKPPGLPYRILQFPGSG